MNNVNIKHIVVLRRKKRDKEIYIVYKIKNHDSYLSQRKNEQSPMRQPQNKKSYQETPEDN
jgi:hypothetical protein